MNQVVDTLGRFPRTAREYNNTISYGRRISEYEYQEERLHLLKLKKIILDDETTEATAGGLDITSAELNELKMLGNYSFEIEKAENGIKVKQAAKPTKNSPLITSKDLTKIEKRRNQIRKSRKNMYSKRIFK